MGVGGSCPPPPSFLFPFSLPCAGVLLAGPMPGPCCLGWAPSAPSGDGRSGGWLGGPMPLGLCFSALVVLAGVLPGSVCSTSAPTGSFQSLCCHGGSGMSHLFSVRSWSMSCGLWQRPSCTFCDSTCWCALWPDLDLRLLGVSEFMGHSLTTIGVGVRPRGGQVPVTRVGVSSLHEPPYCLLSFPRYCFSFLGCCYGTFSLHRQQMVVGGRKTDETPNESGLHN